MTKAFAYLRVSGKGQIAGDGFPRQLKAIREYAAAHDIKIVKDYQENGVSGTKDSADRPAWSELMTALHSNGVRTVIVERLDRLARDLMVQETIVADLRKYGFELVSVAEPDLMANDPTRILVRQMMGAVAQYEKSQIVLKLRGARMRARAKNGRCEGRKPYGFYPGEVQVVSRMKELHDSGLGYDRIAERLNAEGVRPRKGERWWGRSINNVLNRAA